MSGSPPLYRMILTGCLVSGFLQIIYGVPSSIGENSPEWFDICIVLAQIISAGTVRLSLHMEDGSSLCPARLHRSLSVEAVGLIFLQTVLAVTFVAVIIQNGGPFKATVTWIAFEFWLWVWTRLFGIRKAMRELER